MLTILLKNKPLEKHLKELAIEMDEYFDVNKDGVIRRREFVTRWNSFAKHHFQAQSMGKGCAIC